MRKLILQMQTSLDDLHRDINLIVDSLSTILLSRPMLKGIRLVRLRLRGVDRDYEVDFRDGGPEGWPRSPSVIARAFSTGKSSILEFTAYCLDGRSHPQHPEILRRVRSALLDSFTEPAPIVLRADRWLDPASGEVRSPAVIVVDGSIAAINPPQAPAGGLTGRRGENPAAAIARAAGNPLTAEPQPAGACEPAASRTAPDLDDRSVRALSSGCG